MLKKLLMCSVIAASVLLPAVNATATAHPSYPLGKAKSCKAHYVKKTVTTSKHEKIKGKTVTLKVRTLECVYRAPTKTVSVTPPGASTPTTTTTLPPATGATTTTTPSAPSTTVAPALATTTTLGITGGSIDAGEVFVFGVTDSNGHPVSPPTASVELVLKASSTNVNQDSGWNVVTASAGQTSCTLLITEVGSLTLTSPNCTITTTPTIFVGQVTGVTVQASFLGTSVDNPSESYLVAYP